MRDQFEIDLITGPRGATQIVGKIRFEGMPFRLGDGTLKWPIVNGTRIPLRHEWVTKPHDTSENLDVIIRDIEEWLPQGRLRGISGKYQWKEVGELL